MAICHANKAINMTKQFSFKWTFSIFFYSILFCNCSAQPESPTRLSKKINEYLTTYEQTGYSGAILLAEKGKITLHKGYGMANEKLKIKSSPETLWAIGSITKPFTAIAILQLESAGKLKTDAKIGDYINGLENEIANLTIHQLLTHSAGLGEYSGDDDKPMSREDFINFINKTPLKYEPGEKFFYSNVGYSLLGILVEEISGQPYEEYLKENIFIPAGMHQTGYNLPAWDITKFAIGYRRDGSPWGHVFRKNNYSSLEGVSWNLKANGGMLSTPMDMYKWHQALLGETLLSTSAKEKMYAQQIEAPADFSPFNPKEKGYYGYGWAIAKSANNKPIIMHGGSNDIFVAGFMYYPEDDIFLFLTSNRVKFPASNAVLDFDKIICNKKYSLPKPLMTLDDEAASQYIGQYILEDGAKLKISKGDGPFAGSLIIYPQNKKAYQNIIGKKLNASVEKKAESFVHQIIENSRDGKKFELTIDGPMNESIKNNNSRVEQDVSFGIDENEDLQEKQKSFWLQNKDTLGNYTGHEFWAAVGVHKKIYACVKVSFEKGDAYINYVISEDKVERFSMNNRTIGLVLRPKSNGKFKEVNNSAVYKFTVNKSNHKSKLEINIHKRKFKGRKF